MDTYFIRRALLEAHVASERGVGVGDPEIGVDPQQREAEIRHLVLPGIAGPQRGDRGELERRLDPGAQRAVARILYELHERLSVERRAAGPVAVRGRKVGIGPECRTRTDGIQDEGPACAGAEVVVAEARDDDGGSELKGVLDIRGFGAGRFQPYVGID